MWTDSTPASRLKLFSKYMQSAGTHCGLTACFTWHLFEYSVNSTNTSLARHTNFQSNLRTAQAPPREFSGGKRIRCRMTAHREYAFRARSRLRLTLTHARQENEHLEQPATFASPRSCWSRVTQWTTFDYARAIETVAVCH